MLHQIWAKVAKHELKKQRTPTGEHTPRFNSKASKFDTEHWAKLEWDQGKAKVSLMPTRLDSEGKQREPMIFLDLNPSHARKTLSENQINSKEEGRAPRWIK